MKARGAKEENMKILVSIVFVVSVTFVCNRLINLYYEGEFETVPNCEAAEEVSRRKNAAKINLCWVVLICIAIVDKFIF